MRRSKRFKAYLNESSLDINEEVPEPAFDTAVEKAASKSRSVAVFKVMPDGARVQLAIATTQEEAERSRKYYHDSPIGDGATYELGKPEKPKRKTAGS